MLAKEQGEDKAKGASETVIYKIEVPANRLVHFEVNLYTYKEFFRSSSYLINSVCLVHAGTTCCARKGWFGHSRSS